MNTEKAKDAAFRATEHYFKARNCKPDFKRFIYVYHLFLTEALKLP